MSVGGAWADVAEIVVVETDPPIASRGCADVYVVFYVVATA